MTQTLSAHINKRKKKRKQNTKYLGFNFRTIKSIDSGSHVYLTAYGKQASSITD
jgi:hypothetical protein